VHEKTTTTLNDQAILQGLTNPQIKNRIASLLAVVQDASGDLKLADAAEMRLIEEIRCMGQEAIAGVGRQTGSSVRARGSSGRAGSLRREKKLTWHTTFGDVSVMEPQFRKKTKRIRPFVQSAKVNNRGCSIALQRVVTDFGADQAFAQVMDKLVEHYGIVLGESTIRRLTEGHARKIFEMAQRSEKPSKPLPSSAAQIIVEMVGGMVPIVEPDATQKDKRKGKNLLWKEAKICLAHAEGSKSPSYGGTLQGDVKAPSVASSHKCRLLACSRSALRSCASRHSDGYDSSARLAQRRDQPTLVA